MTSTLSTTDPTPGRIEEIRELLSLSVEQLCERAGDRLVVVPNLAALHQHFAQAMFDEIKQNNERGQPTRLILAVGPRGQYPRLRDMINEQELSLEHCHFFFMDEYCDWAGKAIGTDHPLSLRGYIEREFIGKIRRDLNTPAEQVLFPNHDNISRLADRINAVGGIDTCYGGIGIHGHIAFNEPAPGIRDTDPRPIRINDFTVTINAIRSEVGGNVEGYPRLAVTLGMRQILDSRRICLYCRNGGLYDWANTVLRLALLGEPGDDYPVTHIRNRNYLIVTDRETAQSPKYIL